MPAEGVLGVDLFVPGAVLLDDEDVVADGEGVVPCLREGWGGGLRGGRGRGPKGEEGAAGGWALVDCIGRRHRGEVGKVVWWSRDGSRREWRSRFEVRWFRCEGRRRLAGGDVQARQERSTIIIGGKSKVCGV